MDRALSLAAVRRDVIGCTRCTRLREYCVRIGQEKRAAYRDQSYWARPVPGFGDPTARLLVLGLAPGAHGANRTGRMFTGDSSGMFLLRAMHAAGFANLPFSRDREDGLQLQDAYILAAVRCAPPDNKPTPEEIATCQPHLEREWAALPRISVVIALGRLAFDAYWRLMRLRGLAVSPRPTFAHGQEYDPVAVSRGPRSDGAADVNADAGADANAGAAGRATSKSRRGSAAASITRAPALIAAFHPSQQNTFTGRLTPEMLEAVFRRAAARIAATTASSTGAGDSRS